MTQNTKCTVATTLVFGLLAASLSGCGSSEPPPPPPPNPNAVPPPASSSSSNQPNRVLEEYEKNKK